MHIYGKPIKKIQEVLSSQSEGSILCRGQRKGLCDWGQCIGSGSSLVLILLVRIIGVHFIIVEFNKFWCTFLCECFTVLKN